MTVIIFISGVSVGIVLAIVLGWLLDTFNADEENKKIDKDLI